MSGPKKHTTADALEQLNIAWCGIEGARQVLLDLDGYAIHADGLLVLRDAIDELKRRLPRGRAAAVVSLAKPPDCPRCDGPCDCGFIEDVQP